MDMIQLGKNAKAAARILAQTSTQAKNNVLEKMAASLQKNATNILVANKKDLLLAKNLSAVLTDRLQLTTTRLNDVIEGIYNIANLPDPIGTVLAKTTGQNGLHISRVRVPIGVIGVIYESRPNVTVDAACLCLKAGNAVILRGGSESFHTATAMITALHQALTDSDIPLSAIQMIPTIHREAVTAMLKMDSYIDLIIPRGGPSLIKHITQESTIPVLKHLAGLCHTYIHQDANLAMAKKIILNAKMRRTGICGATEVLLIDQAIVASHLPTIVQELLQAGCEIRAEADIQSLDTRIKLATSLDFNTEFLAPIIAIKVVADLSAAIEHIAEHGTQHTEAIITDNLQAAQIFLQAIDSAIVMHNTSTQFADGGEFGMGAEIGIATGKLHARGPVGVEQLTTFKYHVYSEGQIRR